MGCLAADLADLSTALRIGALLPRVHSISVRTRNSVRIESSSFQRSGFSIGLPLALRQPFARQYSAQREFSWTYLESVTICMRRSPDPEPCSRTHRCAQRHARSSIRLFVDSWKPTSCRTSSDRFHSAGYSTQTANPLVPSRILSARTVNVQLQCMWVEGQKRHRTARTHYEETTFTRSGLPPRRGGAASGRPLRLRSSGRRRGTHLSV